MSCYVYEDELGFMADELGFVTIDRTVEFLEHGGYAFSISFKPTKWWVKILMKLRAITPNPAIIEIYDPMFESQLVHMASSEHLGGGVYRISGIATLHKGKKIVRITLSSWNMDNWDPELIIKRLVS